MNTKNCAMLLFLVMLGSTAKAEGPRRPCEDTYAWLVNPLSLRGQKCTMQFEVLQVLDDKNALFDIEGAADFLGHDAVFYAHLVEGNDLLDGQRVRAVVEIVGTKTYVTPLGNTRTVPRMKVTSLNVL